MQTEQIYFYIFSFIIIASSVMVIRLKNIFHCALCLIITFLGVAAVYLLLNAEFVALIQILIYLGAIAVLIIFAVMLTQDIMNKKQLSFNKMTLTALIFTGALLIIICKILSLTNWREKISFQPICVEQNIHLIGKELLNNHVFAFELVSVVLLAALVGAIIIAMPQKTDKK